MAWRPTGYEQMATPLILMEPKTIKKLGVMTKVYEEVGRINATVKSYGGTEVVRDGVLQVLDTIEVTTWFDPRIKADCRLVNPYDGTAWSVMGRPEDVELRHVYMKFKCQRTEGEHGG